MISEVLGNSKSDRKVGDLIIDGNTCNDDGIKPNHSNEVFTNIRHNFGQQFIDDDYFFILFNEQC